MVYKHFSSMAMLTLLFVLFWNKNGVLASQECGSVVSNSLSSPGYPNNYPNNMNCSYSVPIPDGMALVINFDFFELESHRECRFDYLKITNEKKESLGVYCGEMTGKSVSVSGDQATITFFSDGSVVKRGFRLSFTTGSPDSPKVVSPTPVVRFRPRLELVCTANGTLPIYMAVIRNSTTLENATNTARIRIKEEGNFTCRASSKYGTDERKFMVVMEELWRK